MTRQRRRFIRGAPAAARCLTLAAALLAVASCAPSVDNNSPNSSTTTEAMNAASSGAARVDRLTATVTYSDGQERFDPPPTNYQPKINAAQAFAAFARSVDPQTLGSNEKPTILLASYTNFITGKHATFVTGTMDPVAAASSDEATKPWWINVPVWYIRYLHVPVAPAGAPAAPGDSQEPPKIVIQEMVIPVSAATGQVLMMENVSADRTPMSWPAPTNSHGDAQTRSSLGGYPQSTPTQTATRTS